MELETAKIMEEINGYISRITFHNKDNGFAVLRVKVKGHKDLVTVVGNVLSVSVGEQAYFMGSWHNDRNHGMQFKADVIKTVKPTSETGIIKYLASGNIRGIGEHLAKILVDKFGKEIFNVIENDPQKLEQIPGIGRNKIDIIKKSWQSQKMIHDIMIFLQSNGVSSSRANKIYSIYGDKAIEIVSQNPYRLARDIKGIGFLSADQIASNLGIPKDSIQRAGAGLNHVLFESSNEGHCALPETLLINKTAKLLEIDEDIIVKALKEELEIGLLIRDNIIDTPCIFSLAYYVYENNIAKKLINIAEGQPKWDSIDTATAIDWVENKLKIKLAEQQKKAINLAINNKMMVITGGPGTGKTTLVNSILQIIGTKNLRISLCAPTGRAAKRLSESTKLIAKTIHRLLEYDPANSSFKYNKDNYLKCDLLIIDEFSMVDISILNSLFEALPSRCSVFIVGDVDQLPSVGPGQTLKDIINSGVIPVVTLDHIFRQGASSKIIENAHNINKGFMPDLNNSDNSDFYFISSNDNEDILQKLSKMLIERIPQRFGYDPLKDVQVLTPMQRGGTGAKSLNIELQKLFRVVGAGHVEKFGNLYIVGDKVMQTENNYDKEVYNGDIGTIINIDNQEHELIVDFGDKKTKYEFGNLDELSLAYAITIHKSQGSEYPVVIIPITVRDYMLLQKNLLYTAITRGKKLVILMGEKKAIAMAVNNKKTLTRYSKLMERLQNCKLEKVSNESKHNSV